MTVRTENVLLYFYYDRIPHFIPFVKGIFEIFRIFYEFSLQIDTAADHRMSICNEFFRNQNPSGSATRMTLILPFTV